MKSVLLFTLLLCGFGLEVKARCPPHPDDSRVRCPPGFTRYEGRCYLFVEREVDWADAEKACNEYDGNLASFQNQDEYNFIRDLIYDGAGSNEPVWVGGNDAVKEGVWFWSDGSLFNFNDWGQGEPNNAGNEDCMQLNHSGRDYVNDAKCNIKQSFVCAKDPLWFS